MAGPTELKSVADAQQHLKKLKPEAGPWSDTLKLRPLEGGQSVSVTQPNGGVKNYQLWMHNGQLTALSTDNLYAIYEKEILSGIITPINSGVNPITGGELKQVPKGDGWVNENNSSDVKKFDAVQVFVDFDTKTGRAKIVEDLSKVDRASTHHGQKWWFEKGKHDLTPGREYGISDRIGVGKTITTAEGKFKLRDVWGYDDPQVEPLLAQARRMTDMVQASQKPPTITMTKEVFDQLQDGDLKKEIGPVQPRPAAPRSAAENVAGRMETPHRLNSPPVIPKSDIPVGVTQEVLSGLYPPEQVKSADEFRIENKEARDVMRQIHLAHQDQGLPNNQRLSGAQVEDVISRHEKAHPATGAALRAYHEEVKRLVEAKASASEFTKAYRKGMGDLGNINTKELPGLMPKPLRKAPEIVAPKEQAFLNERPHPGEPKPELWKPGNEPWMQGTIMFKAQPGNLGGTFVSGASLMGFLEKNSGVISPEAREEMFKSFDHAYPKLGEIMRRTYAEGEAAKTPEERREAYRNGRDEMRHFSLKPSSLNIDPARAAQMAMAAQDPNREPLPETFRQAHDNKPKEPELVAAVAAAPAQTNSAMKPV